jgi:hypothetical protein
LQQTAIIDNSSLVYLSHLNEHQPIFNYLKTLFNTIYFPSEIIKEYGRGASRERYRITLIDKLHPEHGFYRHCNTYDSIIMVMISNEDGIDLGEAEVYAQYKKVNAHLIISDDKPFTNAITKLDIHAKIYSSLHLISWLDLAGLLTNWIEIVKEIHKIRPFNSNELRTAYMEVNKMLGLEVSKKIISNKCSLKKIL